MKPPPQDGRAGNALGEAVTDAPPDGRPAESFADAVSELASLPAHDYEQVRKSEAKRLGVRLGALDDAVAARGAAAKSDPAEPGHGPSDPEPWPEPVDPAALLDGLHAMVERFVVCDDDTAVAVTLWCAFTWFIEYVDVAPLAVITAPEKRCGKSRLLALIAQLARRSLPASNISPAAVFRAVEAWAPTLLIDEADSFFSGREELRGIIDSGHTRDLAFVMRTVVVGKEHVPRRFSTWGAKAIAGIGRLPDTVMDRALVLKLRRKRRGESVERLRRRDRAVFVKLQSQLRRFAEDDGPRVEAARPGIPEALNDRAQDNWEPLLAIADLAGREWSYQARRAALALSGETETASLSTELLADIRGVFDASLASHRISTADLLEKLLRNRERPWATLNRGNPMNDRQLAKRLKPYGIQSRTTRFGPATLRAYHRADFDDAFERYVSRDEQPASTATPPQPEQSRRLSRVCSVVDGPGPSRHCSPTATRLHGELHRCGGVACKRPSSGAVVEIVL